MKITFTGSPRSPSIPLSLVRQALVFYAGILMTKRLSDSLDIIVRFKNLKKKNNPESPVATCYCLDVDPRPKYFELEIDRNMGQYRTFTSAAHEMVHVGQYATGRCYQYVKNQDKVRFEREVFNINDINYFDCPWEVEAYGRERGLYIRFQELLKELRRK